MQTFTKGVVAAGVAAAATIGIAELVRRTRDDGNVALRAAHDELAGVEAAAARIDEVGGLAHREFIRYEDANGTQRDASLGVKLIDTDFTDLGDAVRAAAALGDGPHAIVPYAKSPWFEDDQVFSTGDRVYYDVYDVDANVLEAIDAKTRNHGDLMDGGWIQSGSNVYALQPWSGDPREHEFGLAARLPQEPKLFDDIREDIGEVER